MKIPKPDATGASLAEVGAGVLPAQLFPHPSPEACDTSKGYQGSAQANLEATH